MRKFDEEVEKINNILEKGDKASFAKAEVRAKKLKVEIERSKHIKKNVRIAQVEVIIGMCQVFLGKFDVAMSNLESAFKKHISFNALNLDYWNRGFEMLQICRARKNVLPNARIMISSFNDYRDLIRAEFGDLLETA